MNLRSSLLTAAILLGISNPASAAPVSGQISLNGFAQAIGSTGMGAATGISFANAGGSSVTGNSGLLSNYGAGSGSFASLGACASVTTGCGTIQNIFNFTSTGVISQFLSLTTTNGSTISFDLTSITTVTRPGYNQIGFLATGFINFTGYDRTAGTFNLTAQGDNITSFSATTLAASTSIPEPMSLALLGGGLAAIGIIRLKRQNA